MQLVSIHTSSNTVWDRGALQRISTRIESSYCNGALRRKLCLCLPILECAASSKAASPQISCRLSIGVDSGPFSVT